MEEYDDRELELLRLVTDGKARINLAWMEYIRAIEEENEKIKNFFDRNKSEIAFPTSAITGMKDNDLLTRNFKFRGWSRDFFCLSGNIPITLGLINSMVFLEDDQKELLNEVVAVGNNTKNKLDSGKYAVILYPKVVDHSPWSFWQYNSVDQYKIEHPNPEFSMYIGKIIKDGVTYKMKDEKHNQFPIREQLLLDVITFDTNSKFLDYTHKHSFFENGKVTTITSLPLVTE